MRLLTVAALTRGMVRLRLFLLLALMAIAAVEPVVHNHSLIPGQAASDSLKASAGYCPACNLGTVGQLAAAPAVAAPIAAPVTTLAFVTPVTDDGVALHLRSRAPPAA
jgi:hypothetical protein